LRRALTAGLLAFALTSCSEPEVSQILVRIEAEPGVVGMTESLEVEIDGGPNRTTFSDADTITFAGNDFPRTIALAPKGDDPSRYYRVVARARRQRIDNPLASTFAQAALIGTYIRGETRVVVLRIEDSCIDAGCEELEHCADADCQPPPLVTPQPLDGGAGDMSVPDMGAARCTSDADCEDAIDCTNDSCTLGRCTYETDASRCAAPANQCLRAICVVGVGCEEEARTGLCDDGEFCNVDDTCVDGVCMGSGDRCPGLTCDEDADACVGCDGDEDCTNGEVCSSTVCTCPSSDETCGNGVDDDCDGDVDCADFDCVGESCGANGVECTVDGRCDCPQSTPEMLCMNGMDDDCDGQADCLDEDCDGATCMSGRICIDRSCQDEPEFDAGVMDVDLGSPMDPDLGGPDFGTDFGVPTDPDLGGPDFGTDFGVPGPEDMFMSTGLDPF
jgi:hypothetical protein